jgi:hypothetical protein
MYNFMAHLGLIIVPLGYADPVLFRVGTPYGASSISGQTNTPPTVDDLEVALSRTPCGACGAGSQTGWRDADEVTAPASLRRKFSALPP